MLKKLLVVCLGAAVVLAAGVAFAVPCAATSECNVSVLHNGTTSCSSTEGAFCPAGDRDMVTIGIVIRDCYGNTLAGLDVTIHPPAGNFLFCEASKEVTTDDVGEASTTYAHFGGCGFVQFSATCEGITIQGNLVHAANVDNDQPADGSVGVTDFARFASHYLTTDPCSDYDCSGVVDVSDFARFASHYLHRCP